MTLPVLYSFRRCPYAIRARMAIASSQLSVELREVILKDKPDELLAISPKATVPVLQLNDGTILVESLDIMFWALTAAPSALHIPKISSYQQIELIAENDHVFKKHLDYYKYADRYPEHDEIFYRKQGEVFLCQLERILEQQKFLMGNKLNVVDYAIFPFIRQFAHVDKAWFDQSEYYQLKKWLNGILASDIFVSVMCKYLQWKPDNEKVVFPKGANKH